MKFEYPINFPPLCQSLNCISCNSATKTRWGFILQLSGQSSPTSHKRGQHAGSAGNSCRDGAGPRYALACQAAGQLLLALAQHRAPSWQLWGLQEGFPLSMAALGLTWEFLSKDGGSETCTMFSSGAAALGLAWGSLGSALCNGAVAAPPAPARGSSHVQITQCSLIFLF